MTAFSLRKNRLCGNSYMLIDILAPVASVQTPNCHDMLTDCHVLNKTTGVCFKDHARQVCPEFCGLCTIGRSTYID